MRGCPCIAGDVFVHTSGGLRRASELWASRHAPAVLTDARFGGPAFARASAVVRSGFRPVVRVRAREGGEIRLTADHLLYSEARGWVAAGDLRPGEAVRVADRGGGFGAAGSREEGHVLGWLVGDGRFTRERAVLSFYGEERRELAGAFAEAVNRVIRPGRTRAYAPVGVVEVPDRGLVTIASARLREFALARGVGGAARQRLPEVVWTAARDLQVGFLQALFEADGYVGTAPGPRGGVRLAAASRELALDAQRLLLNFGVFSRVQRERGGDGARHRSVHLHVRAPRWQVAVTGSAAARFAEEIGFLGAAKRAGLSAYLRSFARGPYRQRFLCHVEGVREDGAEWVYDVAEPQTHSFVANGFVVWAAARGGGQTSMGSGQPADETGNSGGVGGAQA
jgi:ribonucleoside-diphosphate reductase alpha chain